MLGVPYLVIILSKHQGTSVIRRKKHLPSQVRSKVLITAVKKLKKLKKLWLKFLSCLLTHRMIDYNLGSSGIVVNY